MLSMVNLILMIWIKLGKVLDWVDHDLLDESEEENGPIDYGILNPDLFDLNSDEQGYPS